MTKYSLTDWYPIRNDDLVALLAEASAVAAHDSMNLSCYSEFVDAADGARIEITVFSIDVFDIDDENTNGVLTPIAMIYNNREQGKSLTFKHVSSPV